MRTRRAPKRAVWRGHRVWPWALAAAALAVAAAWQATRTLEARVAVLSPTAPTFSGTGADGGTAAAYASLLTVDVVDARGAPLSSCVVELRPPGQEREEGAGTAAPNCEAVELGAVSPGDYLLAAEAPGYRRTERPVHLERGRSRITLALAVGLAISGQVVDAEGRPLPGVSVLVSPIGGVAHSSDAGGFRLSVPGPGVYSLEAHHSDYGGAERKVTVPASPVVLRLLPRSVLELTVRSSGAPVAGAQVVLVESRDGGDGKQYSADRPTEADGGVQLKGLPPGPYTLEVGRTAALFSLRQELTLKQDTTTRVSVSLPPLPEGSVEGTVVDEVGQPVQGASVRTQPAAVSPVQSDAEGRFGLRGVRQGVQYQVIAEAAEFESASGPAHAGDMALRLSLRREKVYRGRVVDESHQPVAVFRIGAVDFEAEDGRFALPVLARGGTVAFTVEALHKAMASVVRPAGTEELGDIVLREAPSVRGVVLSPDGAPAPGALVICEGCRGEGGGERHLTAVADTDGRFVLSITGPYGVLVRLLAMKDNQVAWAEAGRVGEEARLALAAPARVSGRVVHPDGMGAAGVAVAFSAPLLETVLFVTGEDGRFSGDVPPGLYQVRLIPDSARPSRTWTVQAPVERPLELVTGRR